MKSNYNHWEDKKLIHHYKNSDNQDAVGVLYKRYHHLVLGISLKYLKNESDAKDAVIEIFMLVIQKLKQHDVEHFKSWLFVLSKNYLLNFIRKNKTEPIISIQENEDRNMEIEDKTHLNKEELDWQEYKEEQIREAIQGLNEKQKICIEYFYFQSKSYKEIASITKMEEKKVKSAIQNGKRNIQIYMNKKNI